MYLRKFLFLSALCVFLGTLSTYGQSGNMHLYSNDEVTASQAYQQGNEYQRDVLLFLDMLESCHPAFASGHTAPFDIDAVKDEEYDRAGQCSSDVDFKLYLQGIMSRLNDAHSTLVLDFDYDRIYPFAILPFQDKYILYAVDKDFSKHLGKEIVGINGVCIDKVIESFRPLLSSDNDYYFINKVGGYMQFASCWTGNPYCSEDGGLSLTFADNAEIRLEALPQAQLNVAWMQAQSTPNTFFKRSRQPFTYHIYPEQSLCYLEFNTCSDQSTYRSQIYMQGLQNQISAEELEKRLSAIPRFDEFIRNMFSDIKAQQISTLVIDVRDNTGGNSRLCDILLSYLMPRSRMQTYTSSIRLSSLWQSNYPQLAQEYSAAFMKNGSELLLGTEYDSVELSSIVDNGESDTAVYSQSESYFLMNGDSSAIFTGKVYILQGSRTFSSAGMFVVTAADNGIGQIIGVNSIYRPSHYGDLLTWKLPNTGTCGYLSHKCFYRPDSPRNDEISLTPDVTIAVSVEDILNGTDPYEQYIISHISQDQSGKTKK